MKTYDLTHVEGTFRVCLMELAWNKVRNGESNNLVWNRVIEMVKDGRKSGNVPLITEGELNYIYREMCYFFPNHKERTTGFFMELNAVEIFNTLGSDE